MLVSAKVPVEHQKQNQTPLFTGRLVSFEVLNSILDVEESVTAKGNTRHYVTFLDIENGIEKKTKTNVL